MDEGSDLRQRAERARLEARHAQERSRALRAERLGHSEPSELPLSPREREVLALLAAGLTTKAIALRLEVSRSTAVYHLANIYRKLRVHNRVDAARMYRRGGHHAPDD